MFERLDESSLARLIQQATPSGDVQEVQLSSMGERERIRQAAVLAPLVRVDGEWRLLFIRRSDQVIDHKGQVAFPGGTCEDSDGSVEQTALRETWEEIGVEPTDVRVLGQMEKLLTGTGYRITPVVGIIPWPYPFKLSPDEVSAVFSIPLNWLAERVNREERPFIRGGELIEVIYFSPYHGELLWGATARMTVNLITLLSQ
ncbi:MAG TPA: CoA pyrophosphatase [Anaerolineaceae bacterium]